MFIKSVLHSESLDSAETKKTSESKTIFFPSVYEVPLSPKAPPYLLPYMLLYNCFTSA